jgi:hypothetical protein
MIASAGFLLGLLFYLEDKTDIFLHNIGLSLNYMVLQPRWQYSLNAYIFISASCFHVFINGTLNVHKILNFKTGIDSENLFKIMHSAVYSCNILVRTSVYWSCKDNRKKGDE